MFAKLSKAYSQLVDYDSGGLSLNPLEGNLQDMEDMSSSSNYQSGSTLENVANSCSSILGPFCRYAHSTFVSNVENVVASLAQADPDFLAYIQGEPDEDDEDIYIIPYTPLQTPADNSILCGTPSTPDYSPQDQDQSLLTESILFLPNPGYTGSDRPDSSDAHVPLPSIVLTPAPSQSREMSSCVPVQDTCFGARLVVPSHSALNAAHPPMLVPTHIPPPPVHPNMCAWMYKYGHWCAVAPALEEQERKGIFSRPIGLRRRGMRKRASYVRDVSRAYQKSFARTKFHVSSHLL